MFLSAIKRAHDAVEGLAVEAAFGVTAILLGCIAVALTAVGAAVWLATLVPLHVALLLVAAIVFFISIVIFLAGQHQFKVNETARKQVDTTAHSPLAALTKSFGTLAAPMDMVASGLFARQAKKAPLATIAATAAVGLLVGMLSNAGDDDE
jgi:xanthine/uracil/vitamin C permease (AzgA family)